MSLFKKKKILKGKRKDAFSEDTNNSLPLLQQAEQVSEPLQTDNPEQASAKLPLDDSQKVNPNVNRKRKVRKVRKRRKPTLLEKLGLGKKKIKKQSVNLPTDAESGPTPTRIKKRIKKKPKPSFFDRLGLGKKKKQRKRVPTSPRLEGKSAVTSEAQAEQPTSTSLSTLDNTTSSVKKNELRTKDKPRLQGKKKKIERAGNKNNKSLKALAGLLIGIIGMVVVLLLLLPLFNDVKDGNLQGTVTGGNIEAQQQTDSQVTLETVENKEQDKKSPSLIENKTETVEAKSSQPQSEPVENKAVVDVTQAPSKPQQQSGEHLMNSQSDNSNQQITLSDKDFLELSDTRIYREE